MSILARVTCIIETSRELALHTELPSQLPSEQFHVARILQSAVGPEGLPSSLMNQDAISRFEEKRRIDNSR
jgi:hypothetical protein